MKIALNAQLISTSDSYRSAGVSGYSLHLLRALGRLRPEGQLAHTLHAYVNADGLVIPGVEVRQTPFSLHNPAARIAWEQSALPLEIARRGDDLVHGLVNVVPLATGVPAVVTVHDLSFVRTPDALPALKRTYLTALCRRSVAKARQVIAVSQQTADDLMRYFETPSDKITVVHNGVGEEFAPAKPDDAPRLAEWRAAHNLPERFLLYLGTLEPRKNLPLLLRAYARWRGMTAPENGDVKLVIAGGKGWFYEEIFTLTKELGHVDAVLFPGFIPSADLPSWYRAALAFVYPSRFEGFGLPVLEAMASSTPVITSQAPSLLEVAGDAALTVPTETPDALADALELVVNQPALCSELARRGIARAARFSWRTAARETVDVYDAALSSQR